MSGAVAAYSCALPPRVRGEVNAVPAAPLSLIMKSATEPCNEAAAFRLP